MQQTGWEPVAGGSCNWMANAYVKGYAVSIPSLFAIEDATHLKSTFSLVKIQLSPTKIKFSISKIAFSWNSRFSPQFHHHFHDIRPVLSPRCHRVFGRSPPALPRDDGPSGPHRPRRGGMAGGHPAVGVGGGGGSTWQLERCWDVGFHGKILGKHVGKVGESTINGGFRMISLRKTRENTRMMEVLVGKLWERDIK